DNLALCLEMDRRRDAILAHMGLGDVAAAQQDDAQAAQHYAQAHALATEIQAAPEAARAALSHSEARARLAKTGAAIPTDSVLPDIRSSLP
ncbi:MAG: hypothetical protein WDZ49_16465, partial [Litorilinea sp.]